MGMLAEGKSMSASEQVVKDIMALVARHAGYHAKPGVPLYDAIEAAVGELVHEREGFEDRLELATWALEEAAKMEAAAVARSDSLAARAELADDLAFCLNAWMHGTHEAMIDPRMLDAGQEVYDRYAALGQAKA